jgi:hypothetical protein
LLRSIDFPNVLLDGMFRSITDIQFSRMPMGAAPIHVASNSSKCNVSSDLPVLAESGSDIAYLLSAFSDHIEWF